MCAKVDKEGVTTKHNKENFTAIAFKGCHAAPARIKSALAHTKPNTLFV
jgi:hypothetical protein